MYNIVNANQVIEEATKQGVSVEKLSGIKANIASKNEQRKVDRLIPSQAQLSSLFAHYQNGRFSDAEELAISITREFPNHPFGWKILGAAPKHMQK